MTSTDAHCSLDSLRSEKRSFSGYLRHLVERIEGDLGVVNVDAQELLKIEAPDEFLEALLCPKYFLQLIQVIKADCKLPRCVKPTESGLMTAAISIGSAVGMRTPNSHLTWHAKLKWAWQLIRLDLQKELSEERHPDFAAVLDRMNVPREKRGQLDYRKALLHWVGYQLKSDVPAPTDFKTSFRDGRLYVLLLDAILPASLGVQLDVEALLASSAERRAEVVVEVARLLGLGAFLNEGDVLNGHDRVNLIFLSQLLRLFPSIDTFTVLITRGLQNDYCGVGYKSPVHVGSDETFRLFGTREPSLGSCAPNALEDLVHWARQQPSSSFALIHIRDIHRLDDTEAMPHLMKFGEHCIAGSEGALLVSHLLDDPSKLSQNEYLIDVKTGISDSYQTGLEQLINDIKIKSRGFLLRVGVIGVSTDFQISNLLFELQTRFQISYLATCSALTAAKSRRAHFSALDNIERYLDTSVFQSISDFTFWLGPNKSTVHLPCITSRTAPHGLILSGGWRSSSDPTIASSSSLSTDSEPSSPLMTSPLPTTQRSHSDMTTPGLKHFSKSAAVSLSNGSVSPVPGFSSHHGNFGSNYGVNGGSNNHQRALSVLDRMEFENKHLLSLEDVLILDGLFRNASRIVIVNQLAGGFSGALVLLAKSFDAEGHEQGPFVLKLGQTDAMAQERTNFERIEEIIGNYAPYVYASYEGAKRAGLKFAFASHAGEVSSTTTFKRTYVDPKTSQACIEGIIHKVASALNRFYSVARLRHWHLMESYDFDGKGWALAAGGSDDPTSLSIRMSSLLMIDASELENMDMIEFGNSVSFKNVLKLMENLEPLRQWCASHTFLVSFVHGDLNFSNILIDGSENVWLIDFQYTMKAHWLKDLAKIENDAQMEIGLHSHEDFDHALKMTQVFHRHSPYKNPDALAHDITQLLNTLPERLQCIARTMLATRKLIYQLNMDRETNPKAYHITMLRYALHSMCFHHLSHWTRKWALLNACSHAQNIMEDLD